MTKSLSSYVSENIAKSNPLEGGPGHEGMLDGSGVIADTWGSYATRLMDYHDIEPGEAIEILCLSPDQLADPTVHFQAGNGFRNYKALMWNRFIDEAYDELNPEVLRLQDTVDTIMQGYILPDQEVANQEADRIQAEIDDASTRIRELEHRSDTVLTADDIKAYDESQSIRCMERDALRSGVRITLDEFVSLMLSNTVTDPEYPSELAGLWFATLNDVIEEFWREQGRPDLLIHKMVVGREIFTTFKSFDVYKEASQYAWERWAQIEPIFIAPKLEDHFLVTGLRP